MRTESNVRPELVEKYPDMVRINFDVREYESDMGEGDKITFFSYQMMEFAPDDEVAHFDVNNYPHIVSAIVRDRYSADDVEAIINNYLADPEGHSEEFVALQQWRDVAKRTARELIETTQGYTL